MTASKDSINAVLLAVGVLAGHGYSWDAEQLARLVPDARDRDRIMDIARQVMEHRQFRQVRDALRARLQFRDVLYRGEIERIPQRFFGTPPPS